MMAQDQEILAPGWVVTISRQLGSLGCEIAQAAARMLGYRVARRELINQAARQTGSPEIALADIDELGLLGMDLSPREGKAYQQAMRQIMASLAAEGSVIIIGRAGQAILTGRPNVLHVRIIAPTSVRAERLAARQNIALEGAQAQIEASDRYRMKYLKRFYQVNWADPDLYDLVINTARISVGPAADLICQALLHRSRKTSIDASTNQEPCIESL